MFNHGINVSNTILSSDALCDIILTFVSYEKMVSKQNASKYKEGLHLSRNHIMNCDEQGRSSTRAAIHWTFSSYFSLSEVGIKYPLLLKLHTKVTSLVPVVL